MAEKSSQLDRIDAADAITTNAGADRDDLLEVRPDDYSSDGNELSDNTTLEAVTDEDRREGMKDAANVFRVLVKTLLKAGIITERTRDTAPGVFAVRWPKPGTEKPLHPNSHAATPASAKATSKRPRTNKSPATARAATPPASLNLV